MSLASDIAAILTTAGYSNIKALWFDSSTVDQICIIPGGGMGYIASGGDIEKPNVQIQVRGAGIDAVSVSAAESKALAIIDLLHKMDIESGFIKWDFRQPDHWKDDNGLPIFSVEFNVTKGR